MEQESELRMRIRAIKRHNSYGQAESKRIAWKQTGGAKENECHHNTIQRLHSIPKSIISHKYLPTRPIQRIMRRELLFVRSVNLGNDLWLLSLLELQKFRIRTLIVTSHMQSRLAGAISHGGQTLLF